MGTNPGDRWAGDAGSPQPYWHGAAPSPGGYYPPGREPYRRPAPRRKRGDGLKMTMVGMFTGVAAALLVLLLMPWAFGVSPLDLMSGKLGRVDEAKTEEAGTVKVVSKSGDALSVEEIARKVTPSVVNIDIRARVGDGGFFGYEEDGTGSGVIYREDGYILTNNHVVEGAQQITVTLASGEELPGRVVGADADNDIAVVKVDKTGLPAIEIGDSDDLLVGEPAVAVGSPFGFEHSVTSGIISALNRDISATGQSGRRGTTFLSDLIQTDAAVNPGNSGGALCDSEGKLVGVNTVIATTAGGSEGVGFAIPVDTASRVADGLIAANTVSRA